MAIENRNLRPGMRLVARYHKLPYTCEAVDAGEGKVHYRLADGQEFKSPSAAGMAVTGKACNGWAFWSVATETPGPETVTIEIPAITPAPTAEEQPPAQTAAEPALPVVYRIYKTPNQRGVPEGQRRWTCDGCGKAFIAGPEKPTACPQGHLAA